MFYGPWDRAKKSLKSVILLTLQLHSLAFFCAPHCSAMLSSSSYHSQKSQQKSEEFLQGLCVFVCV